MIESSKRLETRHSLFTWGLNQVGIQCLKSYAGLFVWMDLSQLIPQDPTEEGELALWRVIINEVKINVSPGGSFHCNEAGWFRVCIANMDDETMEVALKRIITFGAQKIAKPVTRAKRKCFQTNLHLRLSARRLDDLMGVSVIGSPHSPLPQSPLFRAQN